ncbi:MAG: hypothetical protein WCW68_12775, partial [Methanothrix sp.]
FEIWEGWAKSIAKQVGGKDGRGRLLPVQQSSFNDINMWYKTADPARTSYDAGAGGPEKSKNFIIIFN